MTVGLRRGLTDYGDPAFSAFLRKAFIMAMGYSAEALDRPIIGITNTYGDFNPCHGNVPQLIEAVKRGVMLAGAMPMVFPTITLHESFAYPTSMYLRNLMAMDTEEMIRSLPIDAVVVIGGCDKTLPAQMMAIASSDRPALVLPVGSMLTGYHKGERLGACTDCRRYWGRYRAGAIDEAEIAEVNNRLVPTVGTCSVMGTASTMAGLAEALGLTLSGAASIPAVHADRLRCAEETGRRAVELISEKLKPRAILTPAAFHNAMVVLQAMGGSTNALIHLAAIAGRVGLKLDYEAFDRLGREVPVVVDLKPSGQYYMEHFHEAGGIPALLRSVRRHLDLDVVGVSSEPLASILDRVPTNLDPRGVIRNIDNPITPVGAMAVLFGNLAPTGAVIKQSAASAALMQHEGRAVVFESPADLAARIDSPELDVGRDDILVLRNAGPRGAPGMPEAGYLPIPAKLAREGVTDMVRISDARMSGTGFGTIVLHISPESAVGGPLALVHSGDRIRLNVAERRIDLLVDEAELQRRQGDPATVRKNPPPARGYARLFFQTVLQADQGCDFDFLVETKPAGGIVADLKLDEQEPVASR